MRRYHLPIMSWGIVGAALVLASSASAQDVGAPATTTTDRADAVPALEAHSASADLAPSADGDPLGLDLAYHPETYPEPAARVRTLLAGAALLAGGYGVAFGSSYLWEGAPGMSDLRTPFIGPALAIANAGCGESEIGCNSVTIGLRSVIGVVAGIAQLGGLGLLIEGAVMKTQAPAQARTPSTGVLYAVPVATDSALGFSLGGSF